MARKGFFNRLRSYFARSQERPLDSQPGLGALHSVMVYDWNEVMRSFVQDSPWLRGIVSTIAMSVAMVSIRLYWAKKNGDNEGEEKLRRSMLILPPSERTKFVHYHIAVGALEEVSLEHPMYKLLRGEFSVLTGFQMLYITQVYQELVGEAFWYLERNRLKAPVRAYPIPPTTVVSVPSTPEGRYIIYANGKFYEVPFSDILHFRWPDPLRPLSRGSGIGTSLRQEISADRSAGQVIALRFSSQAIPPAVMKVDDVSDNDLEELKSYWMNEAHKLWISGIPMLMNRDFQVHEFGASFQSLQLSDLRQLQRDMFIQAFGIPPEIIGHQKNANRSTINAAEYLYNKIRILPRIEANRQVLQNFLAPQYDSALIVHADNPVDEDRDFQLRAFAAMPETVKVDEWRVRVQQLPPLGKENGGDEFIQNSKSTRIQRKRNRGTGNDQVGKEPYVGYPDSEAEGEDRE